MNKTDSTFCNDSNIHPESYEKTCRNCRFYDGCGNEGEIGKTSYCDKWEPEEKQGIETDNKDLRDLYLEIGKRNKELEQQIEQMKNCYNCKYVYIEYDHTYCEFDEHPHICKKYSHWACNHSL